MAPTKRKGKSQTSPASTKDGSPPAPFKKPPQVLEAFIETLSEKHIYITHIDSKPAEFKRKMFLVPVAMNVVVVILCALRLYYILPWYLKILASGFGQQNELSFAVEKSSWSELGWEIFRRAITMLVDFLLVVFIWPWPVEFTAATKHGNPTRWRWNVGFREKEIYVRRSRSWDTVLGDIFKDEDSKKIFLAYIQQATSPMLQEQKTGYLLMNAQWNLDWNAMIHAHELVDKKDIALEAFRSVVLLHHQDFGWLCYDIKAGSSALEDEKRRQVFVFRDVLTAMGKEDLFYRWVEVVQYEATQPGGFGPDKQETAAKKIRELFEQENIDFDQLWKDTVGGDNVGLA